MNFYTSDLYMEDIRNVAKLNLPWDKLNDKSVMLSGATGLLGSFFVDVILEKNSTFLSGCPSLRFRWRFIQRC